MSSCSTSWLTRLARWLFGTTFLLGSVLSGVQPPEVYVSSNAPTHDSPSKSQRLELVSVKYEHVEVPLEITLWIMLASIAKIGFHVAPGMSRLLPESCLLLIMGLAVGGLIWVAGQKAPLVMNFEVFFLYLLPPIVMDASYFLPARPFIANIASILCFAIIGTLWNTFGIAFSLYAICQVEAVDLPDLPLLHLLLFGSLASAVDPVAVLSVFEEIGVDEQLYILVFGESMLNDAVTLVLYQLLTAMCEMEASGETIGGMDVALGVARFVVVGVGGIATGLICGFAGAFSSRFTKGLRVLEPLCIFTFSYLSYLLAEMLQLSTIMAVFSCTMGMKQYVEANISTKSRMTVKYFLKMLGSMSETLIFVFLGVSAISGPHDWNWIFITSTLFFCLIWRMLGVFLQAFLMNRFRMIPISFKDQFIIGYGGLRGAIAFSLVYLLPSESFVHKPLFITSTIALIFFTVFIQGSTIRPLVGLLDVKRKGEQEPTVSVEIASRFLDLLLAGIEDLCGHFGHHSWRKMYEHCNSKYLKKLLIREETGSGSSIVAMYQRLERRSALEQIEMLRVPSAASDLFLQEGAPARSEEVLSWHHEHEDLQGEEENVHRLLGRSMYKPPRRHPSYSRHSLPHDDLEKQVAEILLRRRRCLRRPIQTIHRQMTLPGNSSNHNRVPRHHSGTNPAPTGYTMSIPNSRELAHRCNSTNPERFVSTHHAESHSHGVGNDEEENIGHNVCRHRQDASEHHNAWLLGQVDDITEDNQECLTADPLSWTKSS